MRARSARGSPGRAGGSPGGAGERFRGTQARGRMEGDQRGGSRAVRPDGSARASATGCTYGPVPTGRHSRRARGCTVMSRPPFGRGYCRTHSPRHRRTGAGGTRPRAVRRRRPSFATGGEWCGEPQSSERVAARVRQGPAGSSHPAPVLVPTGLTRARGSRRIGGHLREPDGPSSRGGTGRRHGGREALVDEVRAEVPTNSPRRPGSFR